MNLHDLTEYTLKLKQENGTTYVWDSLRKKWLVLSPEEHVRQLLLMYLLQKMHYPAGLIAVEKQILVGNMKKRFDIVVYDRMHKPWMLIECKAPEVPLDENTLNQLLQYHQSIQCRYWLLSNGHSHFCADAGDIMNIKWLNELPLY
jgi:hypothetical protein